MHRMQRKNIFGLKANNFVFLILFFEINIPYLFLFFIELSWYHVSSYGFRKFTRFGMILFFIAFLIFLDLESVVIILDFVFFLICILSISLCDKKMIGLLDSTRGFWQHYLILVVFCFLMFFLLILSFYNFILDDSRSLFS
jgi:hypothetical protein